MNPHDCKWLVWSIEHKAWWRPHEQGYTSDITFAGRYDFDKASEIVANANLCIENSTPNEAMLPDLNIQNENIRRNIKS